MRISGPTVNVRLARRVSRRSLQPGDVIAIRGRRVVVAGPGSAGGGPSGYPLIPQTTARHRAELRVPAQQAAALGLAAQAWLIRCAAPEPVTAGGVPLGRLPDTTLAAVRQTAQQAALAENFERVRCGWPMTCGSRTPPRR